MRNHLALRASTTDTFSSRWLRVELYACSNLAYSRTILELATAASCELVAATNAALTVWAVLALLCCGAKANCLNAFWDPAFFDASV